MDELILAEKAANWQRLKALVLDSRLIDGFAEAEELG
jgi:hypothetical protein